MHYIAEIVLPPGFEVKKGVEQVMNYFLKEDDGGNKKTYADWWDWYVIGGRYSGHKLECSLGSKALEEFNKALMNKKVTVSAMRCGKPMLEPSSQQEIVDQLWRKHFPGKGKTCPLFDHGRDQYQKDGYPDDVCLVKDIPDELLCQRLIVASDHWTDEGELGAVFMLCTEYWNGIVFQKTDFDGNVKNGLKRAREWIAVRQRNPRVPSDDWQVVTVDYHE